MEKTRVNATSSGELIQARKNSISEFSGIEHRLELVAEINETEYFNDSKATDFSTSWFSLSCMDKPVIWIVGGSEILDDYSVFSDLVRDKVKAIVSIGKTKGQNLDSLKKEVQFFSQVSSVEEAVEAASAFATGKDVVLFSPACPSFEMFENYKQRGEAFRKKVVNCRL